MEQKNFSLYTNLSQQELFEKLNTNAQGLTSEQARKKIRLYGYNVLSQNEITWIVILKNQIFNPFMYILFLIGGIYLYTKNFTESLIVFLIIAINSGIGFYQEYSSNKAMQLLKKYLLITISVLRDGKEIKLPVNQLIPGDIIVVYAGDIIPADCRFITDENITIDESSMTGESLSVVKTSEPASQPTTAMYQAHNIGFAGTVITEGKGTAVIFATGNQTTLGTIATLTQQTKNKSNLEKNTAQLAHLIIVFISVAVVFIFLLNMLLKHETIHLVELLLFSAALAITAAPEALPLVTTFCLSRGASRLKKNNVIIKRFSAIGDLGSIEIFCTDKTGTLTENSLKVESIYSDDPQQTIIYATLFFTPGKEKRQKGFEQALHNALTPEQSTELTHYTLLHELPFTAERRRSCSVIQKGTKHIMLTKGSPENVLMLCIIPDDEKNKIAKWIKQEEEKGNRIIAVATKETSAPIDNLHSIKDQDHSYNPSGLISFRDPIKETSLATVKMAKTLNVQMKIISGDSKYVCFTVAKELGLENKISNVITGLEFENASEKEKEFLVENHSVFARINPQQKYELIKILQKKHSVGYIGDGVNDAPALKLAHVGFAVQDSSPIAQESADIILLENNLLMIIRSIKEGRKIVTNILKYVTITTSSSFGHLYALSLLSLFTTTSPILPLQLLLLNILTDLPMMALSTDNVHTKELSNPIHFDIKETVFMIAIFSVFVALFDTSVFVLFRSHPPKTLQATWCITILISEIIYIFLHRTKIAFYQAKKPSTPLLLLSAIMVFIIIALPFTYVGQQFFMFSPPHKAQIPLIALLLLLNLCAAEGIKFLYYRLKNKKVA